MPPIRLIGLFLFITSLFLALMAMATKTSHIDVKRPDRVVAAEQVQLGFPATDGQTVTRPQLQFVSVPIVYPLALVGAAGLLLWFIPSISLSSQPASNKKRGTSRRRKPAKGRAPLAR